MTSDDMKAWVRCMSNEDSPPGVAAFVADYIEALEGYRGAWLAANGAADLVGQIRGDYESDEWTNDVGTTLAWNIKEATARVDELRRKMEAL